MLSPRAPQDAGWLNDTRSLYVVLFLWLAVAAVLMATLPALPVDETRYLTVAWEMKLSGQWLLPTLNGAPYSHKPPLYFWLINLVWAVLGPHVWSARLVSVAATAGVFVMTYRLAREIQGERNPSTPALAVALLAVPATFVYGALLMFDQLLTFCILLGLAALWRAAIKPSWRAWALLGLALGLGMLTKGPVMLLHLVPPALLARFWVPDRTQLTFKRWYGPLLASIALGAVMILSWAIPAAIVGGPKFAEMIFWKQSAGRMVASFHHRQPFWFYVPVLAAFLLPLFFWRPLWRALGRARRTQLSGPARFMLCWLVPAVLAFCFISGKQPHYMLPFMSGVAILAASLLTEADVRRGDARVLALPFAILFLVLAVGPPIAVWSGHDSPTGFVSCGFGAFNPLITLAAGALALAMLLRAATLRTQALAMAAAAGLLIATVGAQASRGLFGYYDLTPLGAALQPFKEGPIAVFNQYAGEHGFMARLARPVEEMHNNELKTWLEAHPGGTAVLRLDSGEAPDAGTVVYSQSYRPSKTFVIVRAKPD